MPFKAYGHSKHCTCKWNENEKSKICEFNCENGMRVKYFCTHHVRPCGRVYTHNSWLDTAQTAIKELSALRALQIRHIRKIGCGRSSWFVECVPQTSPFPTQQWCPHSVVQFLCVECASEFRSPRQFCIEYHQRNRFTVDTAWPTETRSIIRTVIRTITSVAMPNYWVASNPIRAIGRMVHRANSNISKLAE